MFLLTFCQGGDVTNQFQVYCLSAIYGKRRTTEHVIFPCTVTCPGFLELQKCDQAVISGDYSDLFQVFLLYFVFLCYISYFLSVKSKDRNVHGILKERKHVISPFVQSPQGSQR